VIAIDNEHRITYWNKAAEHLYGFKAEEVFGQTLENVTKYQWIKPEYEKNAYGSLAATGQWHGENIHFDKDGKPIHVESSVNTIKAPDGGSIGLLAVIRDISERKRSEVLLKGAKASLKKQVEERTSELHTLNNKLRSMATQLSLAEARERRRIAMMLHDSVKQHLASCAMKIEALMQSTSPTTNLIGTLRQIYKDIQELIEQIRSLTFQLSPPMLYEMGLEPALEELIKILRQDYGLNCTFHTDGETKALGKDTSIILYDSVRELLTNIIKHAKATNVSVETIKHGDGIRITVEDDGVGFHTDIVLGKKRSKGFGLFSIRERLNDIGGYIMAESKPNGSRIILGIPLEQG